MRSNTCGEHALLDREVVECVKHSGLTLDILQKLTDIHRAKLGRMRLCKCQVTCDEAEQVFLTVRRPGRAMMMLARFGDEKHFTPQALAYLDYSLSDMPSLLKCLSELGPTLHPEWAHGRAQHLGVLMQQHADRLLKAERFAPDGNDRRLS